MRFASQLLLPVFAAAAIGVAGNGLKAAPVAADAGGDAGVEADAPVDTGFEVVREDPDAGAFRTLWVGGPETVYIAGDNGALIEKRPDHWAEVVLGPGVDVGGV